MSDFEICASGTFWKDIGDRMEIDFSQLPSYRQGWSNGLQWLQEVQAFSEQYEAEHMFPASTNNMLALAYLDLIFLNIPSRLKTLGKQVISFIVADRLR